MFEDKERQYFHAATEMIPAHQQDGKKNICSSSPQIGRPIHSRDGSWRPRALPCIDTATSSDSIKVLGLELSRLEMLARVTKKRRSRVRAAQSVLLRRWHVHGTALEIVVGHCTLCSVVTRPNLSTLSLVYSHMSRCGLKQSCLVGTTDLEREAASGDQKRDDARVLREGFLEAELRQCGKEEEVTMADSVETLGLDVRTRVKRLGVKEKATRKKCKVRFSLIKKNEVFQKCYMKVGVKKLLRTGMVPGERMQWRWLPTERLKLKRQVAAAAGKKGTTSLNLLALKWKKSSLP